MAEEQSVESEIARIRLPREGEVLGIVTEMLGASKMRIECDDGYTRLGRLTGKLRLRVWIRTGDLVLVEPWKVQSNERCDIIWRYTRTQANWMQKKGIIKRLRF